MGREADAPPAPLRERMIDAAFTITCESGWSAVTMSRIGAAVGVSRQTVYNELGSKPALGQALVLRELDRFLAVVTEELDAYDEVVDAIRGAAGRLLVMAQENPLLHAVLSSAHGGDSELLPLLTTHAEPVIGAATAVLEERIDARFPDLPLDRDQRAVALDTIVRLVLSHVTQPARTPKQTADDIAWIAARILGR